MLLLAKFFAGATSAVMLFGTALLADFTLIYLRFRNTFRRAKA